MGYQGLFCVWAEFRYEGCILWVKRHSMVFKGALAQLIFLA